MDHIRLALKSQSLSSFSAFDEVQMIHKSIPEINLSDVSLRTCLGDIQLESPIIINAMTGGANSTESINRDLGVISRETGVSIAVGSQKSALNNSAYDKTYRIVREKNSKGIVIANISADSSVDDALRAVEMINANFLQIHLNVPQELVMPEGDREFKGNLHKIHKMINSVPVPIIVKEVGFGMCRETYVQLKQAGVSLIDVGGFGGTNFIQIENHRRISPDYEFLSNWGQPTAISLLESLEFQQQIDFISSGGIRHPLDMIKSFALGAHAVGIASLILKTLTEEGIDRCISLINNWHEQLRTIMNMLGCTSISELACCPLIISGYNKEWCESRGINHVDLGRRKE